MAVLFNAVFWMACCLLLAAPADDDQHNKIVCKEQFPSSLPCLNNYLLGSACVSPDQTLLYSQGGIFWQGR